MVQLNDQNHDCDVILTKSRQRSHCYDVEGPIVLSVYGYHCQKHSKSFSIHCTTPPSNVIALIDDQPAGILILPRTMVTHRLWDQIISYYIEVQNISSVVQLTRSHWQREYGCHVQQVRFTDVKFGFEFGLDLEYDFDNSQSQCKVLGIEISPRNHIEYTDACKLDDGLVARDSEALKTLC